MKQEIIRQPFFILVFLLQTIYVIVSEDIAPLLFISVVGLSLLYYTILFLISSKYQKHKGAYHVWILFYVLTFSSVLLLAASILIFKIPGFFLMITFWSFLLLLTVREIFIYFKVNNYLRK